MLNRLGKTALIGWALAGTLLAAPLTSLTTSRNPVKPGQPVELRFQVKDQNNVLTDFDVVHEKTSHLILVSSDYTDFQHVHPTLDAKGTFLIKNVVFHKSGLYYVFMDVTPQGSAQVLKRFDLKVQGASRPLVLKEDMRDKLAGGVQVHLTTNPSPLKPGDSTLRFTLTRQGKPVTDLQPLMGAMGHVIALGPGGAPFLHIHPLGGHEAHAEMAGMQGMDKTYTCPMHPEVRSDKPGSCPKCGMNLTQASDPSMNPKTGPGEVAFHANFPRPGLYKVWGQFQRGSSMLIAPFTVRVQP